MHGPHFNRRSSRGFDIFSLYFMMTHTRGYMVIEARDQDYILITLANQYNAILGQLKSPA